MKHLYIPLVIAAVVLCAYHVGIRIGRENCRADFGAAAVAATYETNNRLGEINAETYHTATADIRRMLRTKYTIAD